ncbi:MAG TPA: oligosaccharide flippase family protein, partial [Methylomirabilota bacterium]|nr:oligosaccharide flippase family protein [Methylomirabilota bacterium]
AALVRNTFWYGVVTAVGLVSGLLTSIVLARGLGPALLGDYSYLLWALRTLAVFAGLGFPLATSRYTAEAFARGDRPAAWGYVRLFFRGQLAAAALVAAAAVPAVLWLAPDGLRLPFLLVALSLFPIGMEGVYTHAVHGAQRYDLTTQTSTVKMAFQLAAAVAAVALGAGILGLTAGLLLSFVLGALLQRRRALELYGAGTAARPAPLGRDVRAFVVSLSAVTVLEAVVWDRSEVFFLRLYVSSEALAYYSLAFGLATRAMVVPEIAVGALLPAFSALHGGNAPAEFGALYRTAIRYVALAGAPIAAVGTALAPALVGWLYGAEYAPAAAYFGPLAAVALLSALRKVAWAALRAAGDRRHVLTAMAVAAVVNVVLAAALIPRYGVGGAVAANSAAQVLATAWGFAGVARSRGVRLPAGDLVGVTAAGLLAFGAAQLVAADVHDLARLALAAAAGLAVFLVAAVLAGVLGTREWSLLMTSTRRLTAPRVTGA